MGRVTNSELRGFWITVLASVPLATILGIAWLNFEPRRMNFDVKADSPFDEPWAWDPATGYGWPFWIVRKFDYPSPVNEPGRFDPLALIFDSLVWIVLLEASFLLIRLLRRIGPIAQCFT
jgi:hypothetical protein